MRGHARRKKKRAVRRAGACGTATAADRGRAARSPRATASPSSDPVR
ncbi:hypothetical protein ACP70R_000998 [Stipagrostis hirtigluma subsp. patula]